MKRFIKTAIALSFAFAAAFLISLSANAAEEYEDNGVISSATSIPVNETVYGSVFTTGYSNDTDYYKFTAPSDGYVEIEFRHDPQGTFLEAELLNSGETTLLSYSITNSEYNRTLKMGIPKGTYYYMVKSNYGHYDESYDFTVEFTPANDWETELNETVVTADTLRLNSVMYAASNSMSGGSNDADYYKFTLNKAAFVEIEVNHDYGNYNRVDFVRYDGTTQKTDSSLSFDVGNTSEKNMSERVKLNPGTYYIHVDSGYGVHFEYNIVVRTYDEPPVQMTTGAYTPPEDNYYEEIVEQNPDYPEENFGAEPNGINDEEYYEDYDNAQQDENYDPAEYPDYSGRTDMKMIAILAAGLVAIICIAVIVILLVKKRGI